jgi:macrolide transport system ATP-binding/permease protein
LIGVLGILWYDVARRTTEIGVRTALGAQAAQTIMLVARQALTMLGAAVVLAIPLVVAVGSLVKSQLYGVAATSPVTFITGVGVLAVTTLVGCIAPSVRAARVDPIVALRGQVE